MEQSLESVTGFFSISGLFVLPFWGLLIFLPKWSVTRHLAHSPWIALGPALLYGILVLPNIGILSPLIAKPTLQGFMALLGTPLGASVAWVHFLTFDLLIGRWIYQDSQERATSALLISLILTLTLMFGPLGYLAYLLVRTAMGRGGWALSESLRKAIKENTPLTLITLVCLAGLIASVFGLIFDHQLITGAPAWLKPAKFFFSISIYSITLLWILRFLHGHARLVRNISSVIAVGFLVEIVIIVAQVFRGMTSHFNVSTPLNILLWGLMAWFILAIWVATLAIAVLLLRQPIQTLPSPSFAWSLRWGVALTVVGMTIAFLMTVPTASQLTSARQGRPMTISGAHAVNTSDDAPGMPVTNWSTTGGDLRIPHFVGLHALQILPLLGLLLLKPRRRLSDAVSVRLVHLAGLAYLGLIGLLTWQALRGEPLLAPEAPVIWAFIGLIIATLGGFVGIMLHSRSSFPRP